MTTSWLEDKYLTSFSCIDIEFHTHIHTLYLKEVKMNKIKHQRIKSSGKGKETSYILIAATTLLITCSALISLNHTKSESIKLPKFQMSAFTDLNEQELAIFNGLYTSAVEIDEIHNDEGGEWLTITELEDSFLPPFVKDSLWKKSGQYKWSRRLNPTGSIDVAIYSGSPTGKIKSGSFTLLFLHDHAAMNSSQNPNPVHAPFEIWYHASSEKHPPSLITDQAFIAAGWKEVAPLSGKDEVKRIKG